jgi:hypothetical protein
MYVVYVQVVCCKHQSSKQHQESVQQNNQIQEYFSSVHQILLHLFEKKVTIQSKLFNLREHVIKHKPLPPAIFNLDHMSCKPETTL